MTTVSELNKELNKLIFKGYKDKKVLLWSDCFDDYPIDKLIEKHDSIIIMRGNKNQ